MDTQQDRCFRINQWLEDTQQDRWFRINEWLEDTQQDRCFRINEWFPKGDKASSKYGSSDKVQWQGNIEVIWQSKIVKFN